MTRALSTRLAGLAAALVAAALPASAGAQTVGSASVSFAKSEALLGGSSALASILAQQGATPRPVLQPASLSTPRLSWSSLRPAISPAVSSGRPDLFGSVALSVRRTPLDGRWRKVAGARVGGSAAAYAASLRGRDAVEQAEAVNRYVNHRVRFVDDIRQFGTPDRWSAANETLRRGRGDCEDYAIAKLQMLREAGVSDRDLYLVIVKDLVRRADHAVLAVRAEKRMLVLDNGGDVVMDADSISDYRPVLTFASTGAWTHGYRRSLPPMQIAAAEVKPLNPAARRD